MTREDATAQAAVLRDERVLPSTVAPEPLEPVCRWHRQVPDFRGRMQHQQLRMRPLEQIPRHDVGAFAFEDRPRFLAGPGLDRHRSTHRQLAGIMLRVTMYVKRNYCHRNK